MALSNFNTRIFSALKHLSFLKTKLVSHSIKVCSHYNFFKSFLVNVVKIMERIMELFLIKTFWLSVGGGEW